MPGKTLDQLEGVTWGKPTLDSYLVSTCHRLRAKPIDEFSIEDLRIMIGEKIDLTHLVPPAVAELEQHPLAEGDFYPGDLLSSVVSAEEWLQTNPGLLARVIRVTERALPKLIEEEDGDLRQRLADFLARVRC